MARTPKLHELLAAHGTANGQADQCRSDLLNTFEKKRHLFGEKRVTFTPNTEGAQTVTEEQSDIQSSVREELKWLAGIWGPTLDIEYQINVANQQAKADVVLDNGTVLLKDVPATALLELEKRAGEIHQLVKSIPTLDPAKGFRLDPSRPTGTYVAREVTKTRTKKITRPLVMYEATDKHPAQVQAIQEDIPVGTIHEQEWSSLITPAEKADMLNKAEELRRAFKTARSRANEQEVKGDKIAATLFAHVFGK